MFLRTSGEQRISNFMLWQAAYAESCSSTCSGPTSTASTSGSHRHLRRTRPPLRNGMIGVGADRPGNLAEWAQIAPLFCTPVGATCRPQGGARRACCPQPTSRAAWLDVPPGTRDRACDDHPSWTTPFRCLSTRPSPDGWRTTRASATNSCAGSWPTTRCVIRSRTCTSPPRPLDDIAVRIAALLLVVPDGCFVVRPDRGLHGCTAPRWCWRRTTTCGRRRFRCSSTPTPGGFATSWRRAASARCLPRDLMDVGGLWVTTPLRTALDLGRFLSRDQALAAAGCVAAAGRVRRRRAGRSSCRA